MRCLVELNLDKNLFPACQTPLICALLSAG
jgi:hypothetical protein